MSQHQIIWKVRHDVKKYAIASKVRKFVHNYERQDVKKYGINTICHNAKEVRQKVSHDVNKYSMMFLVGSVFVQPISANLK